MANNQPDADTTSDQPPPGMNPAGSHGNTDGISTLPTNWSSGDQNGTRPNYYPPGQPQTGSIS